MYKAETFNIFGCIKEDNDGDDSNDDDDDYANDD